MLIEKKEKKPSTRGGSFILRLERGKEDLLQSPGEKKGKGKTLPIVCGPSKEGGEGEKGGESRRRVSYSVSFHLRS